MMYSSHINHIGIEKAGLSEKSDANDWIILNYIRAWVGNPKALKKGDEVWINYKHLIDELPILGIKTKASISKRMTKLFDLNLITKSLDKFGRAFISITDFCSEIMNSKVNTPTPKQPKPSNVTDINTPTIQPISYPHPVNLEKRAVNLEKRAVSLGTTLSSESLISKSLISKDNNISSTGDDTESKPKTQDNNAMDFLPDDFEEYQDTRIHADIWKPYWPDLEMLVRFSGISDELYKDESFRERCYTEFLEYWMISRPTERFKPQQWVSRFTKHVKQVFKAVLREQRYKEQQTTQTTHTEQTTAISSNVDFMSEHRPIFPKKGTFAQQRTDEINDSFVRLEKELFGNNPVTIEGKAW